MVAVHAHRRAPAHLAQHLRVGRGEPREHLPGPREVVLGVPPARVLKTLMAEVDGKPVCAVVPSDCEVSMKKLAGAFGGKAAKMMRPADAERLTGYHVGGISPFGHRNRLPVAVDETAEALETMYVSAGRRGLQLELAPRDLIRVTAATLAPIATP